VRRAAAAFLAVTLTTTAHAQTIVITGGTVYPVSGPKIQGGTVVLRDGRIVAVGANVAIPDGATRVDAAGAG
jgi:imidazolonepropionase-like amidohydrolase